MATRKSKSDTVYAIARGRHEHGYGHVTIHVYGLFGSSGCTLKIDCQTGGDTSPGETYSWKHGVHHSHAVLGVDELKKGYWLMRAINRNLAKVYEEQGAPAHFADFAVRVLRAANVRKMHLHPGVNSRFYGDELTLPGYDPLKQGDMLRHDLHTVEQAVIHWR
jgi:hypothetical protein